MEAVVVPMPGPHRAHEALIEVPAGRVYEGIPGRTRTRQVHLREADGSWTSKELFVAVNAATDPELAAQALAGELHRLDDGRELALSFVYHDPKARRLLVVVPPGLAHLELEAWAGFLAEVAGDTAHPVPAYVREARPVIGLAALHAALAEDGIEPADAELVEVSGRGAVPATDGEWQEVGAGEASSMPVPAAPPRPVDIDGSEVESVPPARPRSF